MSEPYGYANFEPVVFEWLFFSFGHFLLKVWAVLLSKAELNHLNSTCRVWTGRNQSDKINKHQLVGAAITERSSVPASNAITGETQ